jgi:hypothetical protein
MTSSDKSNNFQTLLLQQESSLSRQPYQEHRMQIEARLDQAERYQKYAKTTGFVAILVAAALFPIVASGTLGGADPYDKDANLISVSLAILYFITCGVAAISIASFYSRFAPRARQAREDLRDEMLQEMRQELAELRDQVSQLKQAHRQ